MGKTYFIDVDGTIVPYLTYEQLDEMLNDTKTEQLLPGVKELWNTFQPDDRIIITTARYERHRQFTEAIFKENNLIYSVLLMDLPNGPRILINDTPDILYKKAIAVNVQRNAGFYFKNGHTTGTK